MRLRWLLLTAGLAASVLTEPVHAVLIELVPSGKQVAGYLVSRDDKKLSLRRRPGEKEKVEEFERAKIKIIHEVDQARLGALTKEKPKEYRDYAEELAEKQADPEARDLAVRLFLIAAYLDRENLARGCLLSMSNLAPPAEARKYRAMAYLLDPRHDRTVLQVYQPEKPSEAARANYVLALQHFRRGLYAEALRYAAKEGVADFFDSAPGLMNYQTFVATCKGGECKTCKGRGAILCPRCNGKGILGGMICNDCNRQGRLVCPDCNRGKRELTDDQLRLILRAEYEEASAGQSNPAAESWSTLLGNYRPTPVPALTLETLTEYDPRQCVFRGGKWVEP